MRPLRLLLSLSTCLGAILILSYFVASRTSSSSATQDNSNGNLGAYFNWQSSSLFPPSAIISLTDDNSTFFLARPANFGPALPAKGLNGQLWIGSGFGEDSLGRGGVAGADGELGCSDVPGWGNGDYGSAPGIANDADGKSKSRSKSKTYTSSSKTVEAKAAKHKRSDSDTDTSPDQGPEQGDGTDDHLHHPLPPSVDLKDSHSANTVHGKKLAHADIQSLQETAEIAGKVVLLTRGGCGFLEKVKWVQRRGGVGLIVGDNVRGGGLVTMYARGDTSNVTIPALFTSHTTAHLLSSLVPSGTISDDLDSDDSTRLGLVLGEKVAQTASTKSDLKQIVKGKQQQSQNNDKSTFDSHQGDAFDGKMPSDKQPTTDNTEDANHRGWLASLFGADSARQHQDTRRPPSSGNIDWIQQDDFEDEKPYDAILKAGKVAPKSTNGQTSSSRTESKKPDKGFVIGVQDWRDPDLLDAQLEAAKSPPSQDIKVGDGSPPHGGPKGGSITPGSGEYDQAHKRPADGKFFTQTKDPARPKQTENNKQEKPDGWLDRLGLSNDEQDVPPSNKAPHVVTQVDRKPTAKAELLAKNGEDEAHEGLWVTLTPTSMSSSPFFDTLLVLVISPLVTLTIVYALLLLRSRIRRRRWRAPKSVVDRLPVRTYHTIASTTGSNSSAHSPPRSPEAATSTTPLLHSDARPISQGGTRPRSRTESEVPVAGSSFRGTNNSSIDPALEKREAGLAEWRRRYVGRQKECVVCLEEYVDGVSRVMSLPCGHEFHAECM